MTTSNTATAFRLQAASSHNHRIVIAGGPYWNESWATMCPDAWRVVGKIDVLDDVLTTVDAHEPDIVVLSEACPGVISLADLVARIRQRLPDTRIVLVVDTLTAGTRALIQHAALYGVYHVIVGRPAAENWFETLTATRSVRDVMRYYPDAMELTTPSMAENAPVATPDMPTLAVALGTLPDELTRFLSHAFPREQLAGWRVVQAGATADDLLATAVAEGAGWTTLMVTIGLVGTVSLAQVLGEIHRTHPRLRIAVVAGEDSPEVRRLIDECARENLRNIYVSATLDLPDLTSLVTEDWGPERTAAYRTPLGSPQPISFRLAGQAPVSTPAADPEVAAAQTVAVISGKGSVGKTSFVANCLLAASAWGAVGIDADYVKPSLHLAFQSADQPLGHELDQLLVALHGDTRTDAGEEWTPHDRQIIREWVRQSDAVAEGVRIVPGPSRARDVMPAVPPGLVTALAESAQKTARLTLIDTPGSTMEASWVEAVLAADWIVLVTTPSYSSVLESIDVLRKLDYLHIPRNRLWLVINQRGKAGYNTTEITQTHLKLPVLATIPDQPDRWHHAWRMHHPLATKDRKFWTQIVQRMTGIEPDRPHKKNPFRRTKKVSPRS